MTSPYLIEKKRQVFAEKGEIEELKKLYGKEYPEITDLNTTKFWRRFIKSWNFNLGY